MSADFITDEMAEDWNRQGYLVVPGVYDADKMTQIRNWVEEIQNWPETAGRHMMYFDDSLTDPGTRVLNRVEDFVPYHDGMSALIDSDLRDACTKLFGEEAILFKEKINFKLPGGGGFEAHQDSQAGWEDYAPIFITATVIVDRATEENGCLELARWNHRLELIGDLWKPLTDEQLEGVEFFPCPGEPGDVLFFDSYLPHRSAPNLTMDPRRVLYVTYNKVSDGDHRRQYYDDKRASYPPDIEREADKEYAYRV
jgi:ectoine hydroxylase-related dioxygenase (phytanoyl-CoA dioxygenase family)